VRNQDRQLQSNSRARRAAERAESKKRELRRIIISDDDSSGTDSSDSRNEQLILEDDSDNEIEEKRPAIKSKDTAKRFKKKGNNGGKQRVKAWSMDNGFRTVPLDAVIDRDWLLQDRACDQQYSPQIDDIVLYFPQGHLEHLQIFPEGRTPPWTSFPHKWPVVECKVLDVSYDFPSQSEHSRCESVVVNITLFLTGLPLQWGRMGAGYVYKTFGPPRESRNDKQLYRTFKVSLRNLSMPEYLVPWHIYHNAAASVWEENSLFTSIFREVDEQGEMCQKIYDGKVVRLSDSDPTQWPQSPWESLEIRWNDGSNGDQTDRISTWDATLINCNPSSNYLSQSPTIPMELKTAFIAEIENIMKNDNQFQPFLFPVDSTIFPDYYCIVPVPMYLDLIYSRISNDYYRQVYRFH
jgi:hypothetical protein